jgi:hypothetical protein
MNIYEYSQCGHLCFEIYLSIILCYFIHFSIIWNQSLPDRQQNDAWWLGWVTRTREKKTSEIIVAEAASTIHPPRGKRSTSSVPWISVQRVSFGLASLSSQHFPLFLKSSVRRQSAPPLAKKHVCEEKNTAANSIKRSQKNRSSSGRQ